MLSAETYSESGKIYGGKESFVRKWLAHFITGCFQGKALS